jgi:hypothetical protein
MDDEQNQNETIPDQTITRTVWETDHGNIVIEAMQDGRILVNGSPVEPIDRTIEKMRK